MSFRVDIRSSDIRDRTLKNGTKKQPKSFLLSLLTTFRWWGRGGGKDLWCYKTSVSAGKTIAKKVIIFVQFHLQGQYIVQCFIFAWIAKTAYDRTAFVPTHNTNPTCTTFQFYPLKFCSQCCTNIFKDLRSIHSSVKIMERIRMSIV